MARRLAEVAKYVGVSQATVSRVLNGKPGISDATRAAVLTACDVLGYERPAKLRGDRARLVGIVLPEMDNPIFPALAEIMAGALAKRGLSVVLCPRTIDSVAESDFVNTLLEQHVSGVIFASGRYQHSTASHEHYELLRERSLPTVLINAAASDLAFPRVSTDEEHAIDLALGHLASLGHEQVGMVLGPADHVPSARKLAAFRSARGRSGSQLVAHAHFTMEEGQACAIGLMTHTDPPLTTIRQPIIAIGQATVTLLISQIDARPVPTDELLFEPELVVRASTGPAPAPHRYADSVAG